MPRWNYIATHDVVAGSSPAGPGNLGGRSSVGRARVSPKKLVTPSGHLESNRIADMSTTPYEIMNVEGGRHVKMWTRGVPVESQAKEQLANTARMPFIYHHVAAMPDVHLGIEIGRAHV